MSSKSKPLALTAVAAVLLLLAALALAEHRGWPFLRGPLEARATRALGVPVRLNGEFRLHLLGGVSLQVGHLNVGAGGGLDLPHLADARDVALELGWRDLWRAWRGEALVVRSLGADVLDVRAVRTADGRASWIFHPPTPRAERDTPPPRFGWLQVRQGRVLVDDAPTGTALDIALEGGEGGRGGGWHARAEGRWQRLPLQLRVDATAALPLVHDAAQTDDARLVGVRVEGRAGAARLVFDGRVGALLGGGRLDGAFTLAGPSLAPVAAPFGVTLPQTPPFELAGHLAHQRGVWTLRAERAAIGSSRLAGEFRFDTRPSPPLLTGTLNGQRLALQDLGPAVGTAPPDGTPVKRAAPARVLPDRRFDLPSLAGMNADVRIAIAQLDLGSAAIAPLADLRTQLRLQGGVLRLDGLQTVAAGGRIAGRSSLDARAVPARWTVDLAIDGVDLARWLPVLRRSGRAQAYLSGILGGRVQAEGQGRSTAEILGTLDGQARLALQDAQLSHLITEAAGIDLAQALGVLVRGDAPLPLACAMADLVIADGVVRIRRAVVDNRDSTLRIAGQVNLRDESLALQARVRPKDLSPLSLRTPVTVSGTLAKPQIGVDSRRLAGKVAGAVVLGAVAGPLAALLPLVDAGEGREGDPCAQKVER